MRYTEEMMLQSKSGFCMPFEERGKDVELTLGYGKQKHPVTGTVFFHHGLDFEANHYLLSALASGTVSGIGNDATHGIYQVIRYGKYEVTYAHLANVFVNFGQTVKAGNIVALSGDRLHFEVKFDGKEINPIDFLTMLYGNVKAMEQTGKTGFPEFETYDMNIATGFRQSVIFASSNFLHHGIAPLASKKSQILHDVFVLPYLLVAHRQIVLRGFAVPFACLL
jgi:hypothetical protein